MAKIDRRKFISTASALGMTGFLPAYEKPNAVDVNTEQRSLPISIGVITGADHPEEELKAVKDLGFSACQLYVENYTSELAGRLSHSLKKYQLSPITLICMGPGTYSWNLVDGPATIGLVPRENRALRVERLRLAIDFCKAAGIPAVHSHFGFIPEDPRDVLYAEFVQTMKGIGEYALTRGIDVYFETGQETPITLVRALEDIGTGNLYVNFDTANLVMYGKANSLDALKTLRKYVKSFHAKDGLYPTNSRDLGKEVPIPEGEVDFPGIISFLKQTNFDGNIAIEYELAESQKDYILRTKKYLEELILSAP